MKENNIPCSESQVSLPAMDASIVGSLEHLSTGSDASKNIEVMASRSIINENQISEEKSNQSLLQAVEEATSTDMSISSDAEYESDNSNMFTLGFGPILDERIRKLDEMLLNSSCASHKVCD